MQELPRLISRVTPASRAAMTRLRPMSQLAVRKATGSRMLASMPPTRPAAWTTSDGLSRRRYAPTEAASRRSSSRWEGATTSIPRASARSRTLWPTMPVPPVTRIGPSIAISPAPDPAVGLRTFDAISPNRANGHYRARLNAGPGRKDGSSTKPASISHLDRSREKLETRAFEIVVAGHKVRAL